MPKRIRQHPRTPVVLATIPRHTSAHVWLMLILATGISAFGVAPPAVNAATAKNDASLSIGTLARGPGGWARVAVFRERGDVTATSFLGEQGGPPPVVLMTESPVDGWARVLLPTRADATAPGPATGWVSIDGLKLVPAGRRIEVQRSRHLVIVTDHDRIVRHMSAAVGRSQAPTPAVASFVVAIHKPIETQDSKGPLGPFTLHLAAWSTAVADYSADPSWDGLVIQGTNCPTTCLGRSITNGSIRVSNDNVMWLARNLSVGTPVTIT